MEIYNGTYCVYIHTNKINGKMYVGQTVYGDEPNKRWRNGDGYKSHIYFWKAIQKYGWDGFDHEIIAGKLTKEEADNFERLLIDKLQTYNNNFGYNLTLGGDGICGYHHTEAAKDKIGNAAIGRNVGMLRSEETRQKIRESSHKKVVVQKDMSGNVIRQYDSLSRASRETGTNLGNISSCCHLRVPVAGGFIWEFA